MGEASADAPEVSADAPEVSDELAALWALDPAVVFLNHGSFGACPLMVRDVQEQLRARMEAEPVRFLSREQFGIEVPVMRWPAPPARLLRISAQLYNAPAQFVTLTGALTQLVLAARLSGARR